LFGYPPSGRPVLTARDKGKSGLAHFPRRLPVAECTT
jgi:hypothetical protein